MEEFIFLKLNILYFDFVASFYISSLIAILLFKTMIYGNLLLDDLLYCRPSFRFFA